MKSFIVFFSAVMLVIFAAFPAAALDDTNYGVKLAIAEQSAKNPVWSPDGKTIAFTDRSGDFIFTVPVTGGEPTLIYDIKTDPAGFVYNGMNYHSGDLETLGFTPDGKEIIFRDSLLDPARGGYIGPYDYPDGRHSDFASINMIFVIKSINILTGEVRSIVDEVLDGNVSQDGRYLVYSWFASGEDKGKKYGMKILDMQAGEIRTLVPFGTTPCFTPDSKYVIYSGLTSSSSNLFKIPVIGGTPEQITFFSILEEIPFAIEPSVSPDGEWILFTWGKLDPSIPAVVRHIGAFNMNTREAFNVFPNAEYSAEQPKWSPDGKKFAYWRENKALKETQYDRDIYIADFSPISFSKLLDVADAAPLAFGISGNYPNPFNPSTTISFNLSEAGTATLAVYDITGRKVSELVNGHLSAGQHAAVWNGRDSSGRTVSSGVYFSSLTWNGKTTANRMLLAK